MKEVVDGTGLALRISTALQLLHYDAPLPFSLHFKSKSTLIVVYVGYGLVAWNIDEGAIIWTLPLAEGNSILRASLRPDGRAVVATRVTSGVAWISILDHLFIPQAAHVRTTSPGRKAEFAFYINRDHGGPIVLLAGPGKFLRIISAVPQGDGRVLQCLTDTPAQSCWVQSSPEVHHHGC
ncbi:hypothetical protein OF83DRAFT_1088678 [Amylostereum chailletii]|nr:hypothetical protein OF83DRAFT_1088678 [Amylostereum chailletii]